MAVRSLMSGMKIIPERVSNRPSLLSYSLLFGGMMLGSECTSKETIERISLQSADMYIIPISISCLILFFNLSIKSAGKKA